MAFGARILKDSLSLAGIRLTTMEITLPRFCLSEFNTHRMFSRNSSSSRAIPVEKRIEAVETDPFIPEVFGKNKKGMQASDEVLDDARIVLANHTWDMACKSAISRAKQLALLGVHKQLANRLIEPFCWQTVICSATEWNNFFALRCHPDAQPEIMKVALMMRDLYETSIPQKVAYDSWHMPLVDDSEIVEVLDKEGHVGWERLKMISAGRCARVSYLTHDGKREQQADVDLAVRLKTSGHLSPFEHVARPMSEEDAQSIVLDQLDTCGTFSPEPDIKNMFSGNYRSWIQMRKEIPGENDASKKENNIC